MNGISDRTLCKADLTHGGDPHKSLFRAVLFGRDKDKRTVSDVLDANLISSRCEDGRHRPVIDLDTPHGYIASTTPGHGHLYIDVPMPWWRYAILLFGLYQAGVIERGFFWWAMRRRATFVRRPGIRKQSGEVSS